MEDTIMEDTIMVDTIMVDQTQQGVTSGLTIMVDQSMVDPTMVDTIMEDQSTVDMDLPIVEEQSADPDTIVAYLVLDPADITMVLALDQDHTGLDQTLGFWQEYWEEDP